MTDQLNLNRKTLSPNELLVQNSSSNADGTANDLQVNYESDNESEKPVLLELGVPSNIPRTTSELGPIPYSSNYPLNIQLNSAFIAGLPTLSHTYTTDPAFLYNNPYTNGISTTTPQLAHQTSSQTTASSLHNVPFSAHIPQTVYTWSTPTPVMSSSPNDLNNKLPIEIVPPPVYMSYSDAREHAISVQTNPSWKEKALQNEKDYKKTACDRERTRMRDMNRAFDLLRSKLPISKPNGKKYSKIESLRIAISYINHLQKTLKENTADQTTLTGSKYLSEFNVRQRSNSYRYEGHKSNSLEESNVKFENLDESRSTWSDGYIPNSQDKWE